MSISGEEQVKIWRRSFDVPPPAMEKDHPHYEDIVKDPRYADGPTEAEFPMFESLKLTIERTLPYWNETIVPQIKDGKKILIAAHGNSLRGKYHGWIEYNSDGLNILLILRDIAICYFVRFFDLNLEARTKASVLT